MTKLILARLDVCMYIHLTGDESALFTEKFSGEYNLLHSQLEYWNFTAICCVWWERRPCSFVVGLRVCLISLISLLTVSQNIIIFYRQG